MFDLDLIRIVEYNQRARHGKQLIIEMGPSPYEGDIDSAPVVMLLSNPGYDETSAPEDHTFKREGWPLAGLHPEAPLGLRNWWPPLLRPLTSRFGAQRVSQRVASLQLNPWASAEFDDSLRLPSRAHQLELANRCARRGAILLVMRSEKLWLEAEEVRKSALRFSARNKRRPFVSSGNLPPEGWTAVMEAVALDTESGRQLDRIG